MNRNDFGLWGIDLSPEDFRRALAAYGLWNWAKHSEQEVDSKSDVEKGKPLHWLNPLQRKYDSPPPSADELAHEWKEILGRYTELIGDRYISGDPKIRLEVVPTSVNDLGCMEQLSRPEVGATSVYSLIEPAPTEIVWDWP